MKKLLNIIFLFTYFLGQTQSIGIGQWRSHVSYGGGKFLTLANNTLFCATKNGLFSVDVLDKTIVKFTKEGGLGSVGISALHYSQDQQLLVIGYEDGIIDLINSLGEIKTLKTLRDDQIVADKKIYQITSNGNLAYLATDFGVVVIDLVNQVVRENYRNIGPDGDALEVRHLLATNDSLYIASDIGIQSGSLTDNLLDFNEWFVYPETDITFMELIQWEDRVYALKNGIELWQLVNDTWVDTSIEFTETINSFFTGQTLYALSQTSIFSVFPAPTLVFSNPLLTEGSDALEINNQFWIADAQNGLLAENETVQQIQPSGPLNDYPTRIKSVNGVTYMLYGPSPINYDGTDDGLGYSYFSSGKWQSEEIAAFSNISDVTAIGGNMYFTSIGNGLYDQQRSQVMDDQNSAFIASNTFGTVQLTSIQSFQNSLLISSYNSANSIYKLDMNDQIAAFRSEVVGSQFPLDLDLSNDGILWIRRSNVDGGGIAIFDAQSGTSRILRTNDGLPSSGVSGISIDSEDEAWISTNEGPVYYSGASFPFNEFGVSTPIFENEFLFQDEEINDILTDGGSRIWFGTNRGVWVLSNNLTEVVHRFDADNSPLFSNVILQFAYDENTGEVFILTDKGIISFRSGSSRGELSNDEHIKIFPNPVLPSFSGKVGISGLVRNATVKITDTKGRIVIELKANGGTAQWDMTNHQGDRVNSGIYLVFSSDQSGLETAVGKIAIIK